MGVPPVPYQTPVSDNKGILTSPWADWFRQILANIGGGSSGTGTVTSVGLSMPADFTVTNSPVTTSGTLIAARNNQVANTVFAGPSTGSPNAPTYRALVGADLPPPSASTLGGVNSAAAVTHQWVNSISTAGLPALSQPAFSDISGNVAISQGGTGQTTQQAAIDALTGTQSAGEYLRSDGTHATLSAIQAADVPTLNQNTTGTASNVTGTVAIAHGGTGQTTQQAAINALTGTQSSGKYLRSDGTNASLASIVAADVPTLNQNTTGTAANITATSNSTLTTLGSLSLPGTQVTGNIAGNAANVTGTVAVANGGTGQTSYTNGQLLIGNTTGNTLAKSTLTAGSNITITNGAGTITIASTAGSAPANSEHWVKQFSSRASTNTTCLIFVSVVNNIGSDITYATSATLGDTWTINTAGRYSMTLQEVLSTQCAITVNSTSLTTLPSIPQCVATTTFPANGGQIHADAYLSAGDVVRCQAGALSGGNAQQYFRIVRIG